jgi:hypothetical protein
MTLNEYASLVTVEMDGGAGGFEYPESFESDVAVCFTKRMSVEEAAAKLLAEYETAQ